MYNNADHALASIVTAEAFNSLCRMSYTHSMKLQIVWGLDEEARHSMGCYEYRGTVYRDGYACIGILVLCKALLK